MSSTHPQLHTCTHTEKIERYNKMQHVKLHWILVHKKGTDDIFGTTRTFKNRLDIRLYLKILLFLERIAVLVT